MHEVQRLDKRWNRAYQTRDDATLEVSEFALRVFGDTAVTLGRVRISGATFTVDASGRSALVSGKRWRCKSFLLPRVVRQRRSKRSMLSRALEVVASSSVSPRAVEYHLPQTFLCWQQILGKVIALEPPQVLE